MEKYGFVYIWYDRKHKRYYIGSHWGTENDGYICSSTWMRNAYKRRPKDFKRRILAYINDKHMLLAEENKWLNMILPEELEVRYYNRQNGVTWAGYPGKHSDSTKKLISQKTKEQFADVKKRQRHLEACIPHVDKIWINNGVKNKRVTLEKYENEYSDWNKGRIFLEEKPFWNHGKRKRDKSTGRFC